MLQDETRVSVPELKRRQEGSIFEDRTTAIQSIPLKRYIVRFSTGGYAIAQHNTLIKS